MTEQEIQSKILNVVRDYYADFYDLEITPSFIINNDYLTNDEESYLMLAILDEIGVTPSQFNNKVNFFDIFNYKPIFPVSVFYFFKNKIVGKKRNNEYSIREFAQLIHQEFGPFNEDSNSH